MAQRPIKIERTRNYVVVDFKNPPKKQVLRYRRVRRPGGILVTLAVLRARGPRGGRTQPTSIWYPKSKWTPALARKWGARIAAARRKK